MKLKHIIILLVMFLTLGSNGKAQNTNTLYFMDNVAERININPAFMPNCNFYLDFIFLPNLYLNAGTNSLTLNDLLYMQDGKPVTVFSSQENINKIYNTLSPTTNINFNLGLNILSFGFRVKKNYFSFDIGINADANIYLPKDIFKLAFYGTPDANGINTFNLSSLGIESTLYSKIGFGYMNQINKHWQIGLKAKFLMGYANIDTRINSLQLDASRHAWHLKTDGNIHATLPLHFNRNEDGSMDLSSASLYNTNDLISLLYKPAGYGGAIDFGLTYQPIKNLTISTSITDLGFIYWTRNAVSGQMHGEHEIDGIIDYTIGDSISIGDQINNTFNQLGEDIIGTIKTNDYNNAYMTMLKANFYTGIEYGILKNRISFGAVNRLTFNNRRLQDEVTLAINFRPVNWLKATFDYSFLNGRWGNLGLGLNLRVGIFNMYLLADYIPISFTRLHTESMKIPIPNKTQCFNLQIGWTWNIGNYSKDPDRDGIKGRRDHCPNTDIDFLRSKCPDIKKRKHFVDKHGCDLDDDKDGIHNCYDQCPETPLGVEVDSVGCPFDTDKDGIYDYQDHCPDTPEGVEVTAMGCPTDADNDGVADYLDQCPETPANVLVDSIGCPVDNDKDGIADYIDLCPDTPENVSVDANGCPIDSDEDGIADYLDLCPETPLGVTVNENGCPTDTDKDGVADYLDKCPNTPEGTIVNEMGCPLDTDGDGILDSEDKCPQQPGPASNYGCPELKKEVRNLFKKAMTGIQFETGKDIIKKSSYPILDQIVSVMELNPEYHLTISGHTDNVGDDNENMQLSIDRAAAVGKYIIDKGINASRITTQGFGETKPIADNKTSKGRAKNRRVEFEISFEEVTYEKVVNPELQNILQPTDSINNNTIKTDSIK
ncbi:MAG: OmpA family protein [Paludibacteraceae bacterium]|nr:OmpA family protein [Paludibacteraceae bacterium]